MTEDGAIINPAKGKNSPDLGPVAVMASNGEDLRCLCHLFGLNKNNSSNFFMSRLYRGNGYTEGLSIAGPFIGAPYATILLETLIAWGARKIMFLGLCGAVSRNVKIGDIIVPAGSIVDEGTSKHYQGQGSGAGDQGAGNHKDNIYTAYPSDHIVQKTRAALKDKDLSFHEGLVWSTDAIYRETREKVEHFQNKDVLAVEMETSAIFTAGKFRDIAVGGILVVSDELSTFKWQTGFKDKRFLKNRKAVCEVISGLWKKI